MIFGHVPADYEWPPADAAMGKVIDLKTGRTWPIMADPDVWLPLYAIRGGRRGNGRPRAMSPSMRELVEVSTILDDPDARRRLDIPV